MVLNRERKEGRKKRRRQKKRRKERKKRRMVELCEVEHCMQGTVRPQGLLPCMHMVNMIAWYHTS